MKKWEKTIEYINQEGTAIDKLRLKNALDISYENHELENILLDYQFSNGSWDYNSSQEIKDRIGSLGGTIHCLRWIREFHLENSPRMILTLSFLEKIQEQDGSFYETEAKLSHSPQRWLQEETIIDRFYFTAAVPMRLFSLNYNKNPVLDPAINWLKRNWDDWNIVAGTWYGAWALLCLYPYEIGLPESLFKHCYDYSLNWIPKLPSQPLTWLLDALMAAGYPFNDELLKKGIKYLKKLQNDNGIWEDKKYSTTETTITALRIIALYEKSKLD
ncbi:MAG: hypothetical protein ACFE9C_09090 [Candidatus Hodarchaeota archaeon]